MQYHPPPSFVIPYWQCSHLLLKPHWCARNNNNPYANSIEYNLVAYWKNLTKHYTTAAIILFCKSLHKTNRIQGKTRQSDKDSK